MIRCAIWYHLYNLKNFKNNHGGVLVACNSTKSNTPPWLFLKFLKLYKRYQIEQRITIVVSLLKTEDIFVWWYITEIKNNIFGNFLVRKLPKTKWFQWLPVSNKMTFPISGQFSYFIPPENTRKQKVLWCFV